MIAIAEPARFRVRRVLDERGGGVLLARQPVTELDVAISECVSGGHADPAT